MIFMLTKTINRYYNNQFVTCTVGTSSELTVKVVKLFFFEILQMENFCLELTFTKITTGHRY